MERLEQPSPLLGSPRHRSCISFLHPSGAYFHPSALLGLGITTGCRLASLLVSFLQDSPVTDTSALRASGDCPSCPRTTEEQKSRQERKSSLSRLVFFSHGDRRLTVSTQAARPLPILTHIFPQSGLGLQVIALCKETASVIKRGLYLITETSKGL